MHTHIVVTRFSMPIPAFKPIHNRREWFAHRAQLFHTYYVPSIQCQLLKPQCVYLGFDWCDRDLVREYLHVPRGWVKFFCDQPLEHRTPEHNHVVSHQLWAHSIWQHCVYRYSKTNVCISRIDSDDMIAEDYFLTVSETVQQNPLKDCYYIVNTQGAITDTRTVRASVVDNPPFISYYVKQFLRPKNIFDRNHGTVLAADHVHNHQGAWMQIAHEHNQINSVEGGDLFRREDFSKFAWR